MNRGISRKSDKKLNKKEGIISVAMASIRYLVFLGVFLTSCMFAVVHSATEGEAIEELSEEKLKKSLANVLNEHQDSQCNGEVMMRAQTWLDYESEFARDYNFFVVVWNRVSNAAMSGNYIQLSYPKWRVLVFYAKKGSVPMAGRNSNIALEDCENKKGHHQCSANIWSYIKKKRGRGVVVIVDDKNFYHSRARHTKNMVVTESIKECYSETTGVSFFKKTKEYNCKIWQIFGHDE